MKPEVKKNSDKEIDYCRELSIADGKMPPNAVEFERLVIGTVLVEKTAIDRVKKRFSGRDEIFFDPKHQVIFKAMLDLQEKEFPIDIMTVIQELKRNEKLSAAGGDHYIIEMTMGISSSAHLDFHLMIILQKFLSRKMIANCAHTIDLLYRESADTFEEIENHITKINEIEEIIVQQKQDATSIELHHSLIEQQKLKIVPGIASKHNGVEKKLRGWRNGDMIVIAGRPAMGKTTFVLDDVFYAAKKGHSVGFFSLEMSAGQLHTKMVSNETEIPGNAFRDMSLNDNDMQKLYETSTFDKLPFHIVENTNNLNQILAKARLLKKEKDVKIIVIDYLQLIEINDSKGKNDNSIVSVISRKLKLLALELQIPVIVLSQLSRAVEQRPGKRPQLSDLRDSGAIEQDADVVGFLFRPEYYKIATWDNDPEGEESSTLNQAEFICAKFRNGAPFESRLNFRGDYSKFFDLGTDFEGYVNPVPLGDPSKAFEVIKEKIEDDDFPY
jgi:replicative DNA helicase